MFFQNSVIKKYLAALNTEQVTAAWNQYKAYFLNKEIQDNIRSSKEEQFQEGFLRELFVKVFGYTLNPSPNFNLITEQKNETDAKKADGAILRDDKVIGVIELKDHKTTDLSHVERQAFGYKSQHKDTKYVVISNFEKLRFYIDNAVEHIEWNLFTLTESDFRLLYFCLAWQNISTDLPLKAKQESVSNEDQITQQLYKDYSAFKREIFADILKNNTTEETPKEQILLLFRKTQKLLDRLLFIFFAEDCGLLPPNSMVEILKQWEQLKEMDEYVPLYGRIRKYFGYMDTGWQGKKYEIFAYNGGLFKPDEVLDSIKISDDILARFTRKLADYDYSTEVDVNILGHIFENSLNEIEEVTAQINAGEAPTVSKRKRDGVFYTPQYITKYIVENTVGRLCAEKKAEMGIDEAEYFADKNRQMATKKRLLDQLTKYRDWLLSITICDPACGSGAFLNSALQFLMAEHKLLDEMEAKITGSTIAFQAVENSILENNLYGVDINEESVEIARLALWLRTAKPHRKLNSLNDNIKCGNSLISDPAIAGEKAFDWQAEFPQVFAKGGFDIVIGNPPYVFAREKVSEVEKEYYVQNYVSAKYQVNTYILFMEQSMKLMKQQGIVGLIVPNSWLMTYSGEALRRYYVDNFSVESIVNLMGKSFEEANVETVIVTLLNQKAIANHQIKVYKTDENSKSFEYLHSKKQDDFRNNNGCEFTVFKDDESDSIIQKMNVGCRPLDEVASVKAGLQAYEKGKGIPKQTAEDVKARPYDFTYQYNEDTYKYLDGGDVLRYGIRWSGQWLWYGEHLAAPRTLSLFTDEKIIIREITGTYPRCINAVYTKEVFLYNRSNIAVVKREGSEISLPYILVLLNSSLMSFYFKKNTAKAERKLFPKIILNDLRLFPIKEIPLSDQQPYVDLADRMLSLNRDLQSKRARFLRRLQDNMPDIKITGSLETFDTLDFAGFVAELKKQKIKLSLVQQDEWEDYFTQYKSALNDLSAQIVATDRDIDTRVYALYDLTEEEIKVIEG